MANYTYQRPLNPVRNYGIVIAGRTGCGKSSTGNTILGRTAFKAEPSALSVTGVSSYATSVDEDRTITVVDTPGVHNNVRSASMVQQEIARMAFLLQEGVHCFIICISASEVGDTGETQQFLDQWQVTGHADFFDYCMLVYTKPESELYDISLKEFLERQKENANMKSFLERIGDRVLAVNNKARDQTEKAFNKDAIMEIVEKVIVDNINNNRPIVFTNDTFKTAKELREKVVSAGEMENCHPSLVNAATEAVICFSNWGTIAEKEFVEKVISILCNSEQCVNDGTNLVFRNDNEITTAPIGTCKEHIKMAYKAIQSNMSAFYKILAQIRNHKSKYTLTAAAAGAITGFAVGMSGVAAVGAMLGVPAVIAFYVGDRIH